MNRLKNYSLIIISLLTVTATAAAFGQQASGGGGAPTVQVGKNVNDAVVIEILEKHIAAIGGRDAQKAIKTVETQSETEALGTTNKRYRIQDRATKRFYTLMETANGKIEEGFDGARLWRKTPYFKGYVSDIDPQAKAFRRNLPALYEYRESGKKFSRLPNETIDGKEYSVLKSTDTGPLGKEVDFKYYFDPATFLLKQIVMGAGITQTTVFDDYRKVDGKMNAFTTIITSPQITAKTRIVSIKYNVPVDASKFEYRDESAKPANATAPVAGTSPTPVEGNKSATAQETGAGGDALPEAIRLETFEFVWKTVNDTYWDTSFGGVDWRAVHDRYLPRAKQTVDAKEFHQLLDQMIGELRRSHFKVLPPDNVRTIGSQAGKVKQGSVGLKLRWIDAQLLVVDVDEDSPAYAAGIRKGFVLTKINNKTPDEIYTAYKQKNTGFQFREELGRTRAAGEQLAGKADAKVELEVLNEKNTPLRLTLARKERPLDSGNGFKSKLLDQNTGYIKFDIFLGDVLEKFQAAVREFRNTKALIIDLRGNPGGIGQLAPAIASSISATDGSLGSFQFRYQTQSMAYKGTGANAYKGRIILLVDESSGSTSEVFAGGLQESGRATVIGAPTAGAVLPSIPALLPTGGALVYVVSNFQTPKGIVLEGRGVHPDIAIKPLRADFLAGRDTILQRAIETAQSSTPLTKSAVK